MALIDMIPPNLEWRVYKGDTANLTLIVKDENDELVDLTPWTFAGHIKKSPKDAEPEFIMAVTATSEGIISVIIEDSHSLYPQMYFDIEGTHTEDGVTKTFVKGTIIAEEDVTDNGN